MSDKAKKTEKKPAAKEVTADKKVTVDRNEHGEGVVTNDPAVNPIAKDMLGFAPAVDGQSTEPGEPQDSPEAKQPDIPGEINESVVNPVQAPVEPQGVPEAVERRMATPNAQEEPTFHNGADYNRLKTVFLKVLDRLDVDTQRLFKREAGIL